jgi:hypothetical protein
MRSLSRCPIDSPLGAHTRAASGRASHMWTTWFMARHAHPYDAIHKARRELRTVDRQHELRPDGRMFKDASQPVGLDELRTCELSRAPFSHHLCSEPSSRAEPSRAEPSRAEPSRASQLVMRQVLSSDCVDELHICARRMRVTLADRNRCPPPPPAPALIVSSTRAHQ